MSLSSGTSTQQSTQTFITSLVTNIIIASVEIGLFVVLRRQFRKIYSPRSYLVPPEQRVNDIPHGLFSWIPAIFKADPKDIILKNGLDAYVFVRFLRLMVEIFLPISVVTWIILLPVDAAMSTGTNVGLNKLTFGNVGDNQSQRYAAHIIVTYICTFWILYLVRREMAAFVILRQDFLISKRHSGLPQSKTVLVTGVVKEYLNEASIQKFCEFLPGGVKRVWIARDLKDLPDLYDRRTKACNKLESATFALLKKAAKAIEKSQKKKKDLQAPTPEELEANPDLSSRYVSAKDRPHHKLGFLGLFGKKVDSIDWARDEIAETNKELASGRQLLGSGEADNKFPAESAAFIQFNKQIAAHMFAQSLSHHSPLRMSAKYLEVGQEDVVWSNLSINPYQAKIRYVLSWVMTIGLIILWAFPVAFVGSISNVSSLCVSVSWMGWICRLPAPVPGIISGVLPPVALAVLFLLLPIVLRLFARFEGIPLRTQIELSLMTRYFLFLVIHGFLIVTLASGLIASVPLITKNPGSAVNLLANKLPTASTFFLTYIVTTSLSGAAGSLLQIVGLIIYYVKLILLGSTPRSVFGIRFGMPTVAWGTLFPNMTLLAVIGITYSVIAPVVAGFSALGFFLFWFVYKYLFTWVTDTPDASETGGLFYPKALSHIMVGLYIEEVCLTGLFFLKKKDGIAEGVLMVVLIVLTVLFHITLNSGYGPLIKFLPISLAGRIDEIQAEPDVSSRSGEKNSDVKQSLLADNTYPPIRQDVYNNADSLHRPSEKGRMALGRAQGEEQDVDQHAFDHPASYEEQRTIWMPKDKAGLWIHEYETTRSAGIDVSTDGATMNEKGKCEVSRAPPGEDWDESQKI